MSRKEGEGKATHKVVVNEEGRYSIWPADRENARGFSDAGTEGTEAECLAYVEEAGTGKRPPSPGKKAGETEPE